VRQFALGVLVMSGLVIGFTVRADDVGGSGRRLAEVLDGMDVEHLWLSGHYVDWKTGAPRERAVTDGKSHTHCSAFVAAACQRLNVYILRPPDHSETQLANAQADWLREEGAKTGWKPVRDGVRAQHLANRGVIVVAVYKSHDPKKSGHIAIVRPDAKGDDKIRVEGPQVIQAGMTNHQSTSLKEGFRHHPDAWSKQEVRYYAHEPERGK
jgi:hypothetical protein